MEISQSFDSIGFGSEKLTTDSLLSGEDSCSSDEEIIKVQENRSIKKKRVRICDSEENEDSCCQQKDDCSKSSSPSHSRWVQCDNGKCQKWRKVDYSNDLEEFVGVKWVCALNKDEGKSTCEASQESIPSENEESCYTTHTPGSLLWGKVNGYPWWPCIVEKDPDFDAFYWNYPTKSLGGFKTTIHVTFLGKDVSRAWLYTHLLRPFNGDEKLKDMGSMTFRKTNFRHAVIEAFEDGKKCLKLDLNERLLMYGFCTRYNKEKYPECSEKQESKTPKKKKRKAEETQEDKPKKVKRKKPGTSGKDVATSEKKSRKEKNELEKAGSFEYLCQEEIREAISCIDDKEETGKEVVSEEKCVDSEDAGVKDTVGDDEEMHELKSKEVESLPCLVEPDIVAIDYGKISEEAEKLYKEEKETRQSCNNIVCDFKMNADFNRWEGSADNKMINVRKHKSTEARKKGSTKSSLIETGKESSMKEKNTADTNIIDSISVIQAHCVKESNRTACQEKHTDMKSKLKRKAKVSLIKPSLHKPSKDVKAKMTKVSEAEAEIEFGVKDSLGSSETPVERTVSRTEESIAASESIDNGNWISGNNTCTEISDLKFSDKALLKSGLNNKPAKKVGTKKKLKNELTDREISEDMDKETAKVKKSKGPRVQGTEKIPVLEKKSKPKVTECESVANDNGTVVRIKSPKQTTQSSQINVDLNYEGIKLKKASLEPSATKGGKNTGDCRIDDGTKTDGAVGTVRHSIQSEKIPTKLLAEAVLGEGQKTSKAGSTTDTNDSKRQKIQLNSLSGHRKPKKTAFSVPRKQTIDVEPTHTQTSNENVAKREPGEIFVSDISNMVEHKKSKENITEAEASKIEENDSTQVNAIQVEDVVSKSEMKPDAKNALMLTAKGSKDIQNKADDDDDQTCKKEVSKDMQNKTDNVEDQTSKGKGSKNIQNKTDYDKDQTSREEVSKDIPKKTDSVKDQASKGSKNKTKGVKRKSRKDANNKKGKEAHKDGNSQTESNTPDNPNHVVLQSKPKGPSAKASRLSKIAKQYENNKKIPTVLGSSTPLRSKESSLFCLAMEGQMSKSPARNNSLASVELKPNRVINSPKSIRSSPVQTAKSQSPSTSLHFKEKQNLAGEGNIFQLTPASNMQFASSPNLREIEDKLSFPSLTNHSLDCQRETYGNQEVPQCGSPDPVMPVVNEINSVLDDSPEF